MPQLKFDNEGQKRPKKQKLVKHRRKNWAKTDISDVERHIEDLNRQKLAGGILAEKKDEELFVISKKPMKLVEENDNEDDELVSRRKAKRTSFEEKLNNLACYRSLKPDVISAPAHIVGHKPEPNPKSKRQAKLAQKTAKKGKKAAEKKADIKTDNSKAKSEKFDVCFETKPTDIWNSNDQ